MGSSSEGYVANLAIVIDAPRAEVWDAPVDAQRINESMIGTLVTSDGTRGTPIAWSGEWQRRTYEDQGLLLKLEPRRLIRHHDLSPLSGLSDAAEIRPVTLRLSGRGRKLVSRPRRKTRICARERSEQKGTTMLEGRKKVAERQVGSRGSERILLEKAAFHHRSNALRDSHP